MIDARYMRLALRLAKRGYGTTSPNPMVGAVLVKAGKVIGRGWHRAAGKPHAEVEALRDAQRHGHSVRGATLYVTLEPCCTHGRTPPCTEAILNAGIRHVVVGAKDPNPQHAGKGLRILRKAGVKVTGLETKTGSRARRPAEGLKKPSLLQQAAEECAGLNEAFNHRIVHGTPFVMVKAAMTLDGKIATAKGESKWITGAKARAFGMRLRQGSDAILVGVNTVLKDDPSLTLRSDKKLGPPRLRRIVLDSMARTPLNARVVSDAFAHLTTIVVTRLAPKNRVAALARKVTVLTAPTSRKRARLEAIQKHNVRSSPDVQPDLHWLLQRLGAEGVNRLLVEGGGEVNASFLFRGLAQQVVFFYAPKVLGGRRSRRSIAGAGAESESGILDLRAVHWGKAGEDLVLTARVA